MEGVVRPNSQIVDYKYPGRSEDHAMPQSLATMIAM